jgi:DNA-binding LacI/PurR family transcriptional regulator
VAGADEATAVCCTNDVVAIALIDRLERSGRRVPEDVSVVGFDDIPLAGHGRIDLTTVRQPAREMGRLAAEMVLSAIADRRHAAARVVMPTELIVRGSTGPAAEAA